MGGDLTSDLPGRSAIQVAAPNVTDPVRRQEQIDGFTPFHHDFTKSEGVGPRYINSSCGNCHVNNGRGPLKFSLVNRGGSTMVVKVSVPGLQANGAPKDVPGVGEQLLDQSLAGSPKVHIKLLWKFVSGHYPDGTKFQLRKPDLQYRIDGMSRRKIVSSLRMPPPIIGPGLVESVPASEILERDDPNDANHDGISGHPQYVIDARSGQYEIGRFGFRGSHTTVEEQTAAAAYHDMGMTNGLFFDAGKPIELADDQLNITVVYEKLAGVPRARNQDDPHVINGKALFQSVGCEDCHRMTLITASDAPDPELRNQTIHPFTDLLLHDMGSGLADRRSEFFARGSEWRTTPLWGLGYSRRLAGAHHAFFLHDGRARSVEEAILWHGGEASKAKRAFEALKKSDRKDLLLFLDSL